ncbi:hypothetical protein J5N97_015740 [Dioscorea zingiberensis]|uniref:DUF4408 domain-containing protein n=1 Tax=Dioscorea zingiberensis TaxID=325984 RepID=A0A9D5CIP9_9LILI|nr:hypothetical protein J5N97_015740 [Dioscorea zingiberensis]
MEIMDTVKAEKASAMLCYHWIQTIGGLYRYLEAYATIMIISWSSAKLLAAARLSGDLLRSAAAVVLNPRFVFMLGNAIVLVLFAKSGNLSPSPTSTTSSSPELEALRGDFGTANQELENLMVVKEFPFKRSCIHDASIFLPLICLH